MQLGDLFDLSLVCRAGSPALDVDSSDGIRTLTFGDLDGRANRMAHALAARGIGPGDRVAVYLANCLEFIDLFLACLRLGAIFVPINILYREREIAQIVADADPRLIVTAATAPDLFPAESPVADLQELSRAADAASGPRFRTALDGDAPAALVYTSGTTGRSKGAILTHNNFLANTVNIVTCWRITSDDR